MSPFLLLLCSKRFLSLYPGEWNSTNVWVLIVDKIYRDGSCKLLIRGLINKLLTKIAFDFRFGYGFWSHHNPSMYTLSRAHSLCISSRDKVNIDGSSDIKQLLRQSAKIFMAVPLRRRG